MDVQFPTFFAIPVDSGSESG